MLSATSSSIFNKKNSIFHSLEIHICIELRWVRVLDRFRWFIISRTNILRYFCSIFYVSGLRMKYISRHCFAHGRIVVDIVEMEIWHRCYNWSRQRYLPKNIPVTKRKDQKNRVTIRFVCVAEPLTMDLKFQFFISDDARPIWKKSKAIEPMKRCQSVSIYQLINKRHCGKLFRNLLIGSRNLMCNHDLWSINDSPSRLCSPRFVDSTHQWRSHLAHAKPRIVVAIVRMKLIGKAIDGVILNFNIESGMWVNTVCSYSVRAVCTLNQNQHSKTCWGARESIRIIH